jgi:hypothetical protein
MSRRPARLNSLQYSEFGPSRERSNNRELESLWFTLSLSDDLPMAIVPVPDVQPLQAVRLSERLAAVGATATSSRVLVIDASDITISDADDALSDLRKLSAWTERCLVVAPSPTIYPAAVTLVRACKRVLLLCEIGTTETAQVEASIQIIGPDHVVGALALSRRSSSRRRGRRRVKSLLPALVEPIPAETLPIDPSAG